MCGGTGIVMTLSIDLYLLPPDEQLYESSACLLKLSDNREMH